MAYKWPLHVYKWMQRNSNELFMVVDSLSMQIYYVQAFFMTAYMYLMNQAIEAYNEFDSTINEVSNEMDLFFNDPLRYLAGAMGYAPETPVVTPLVEPEQPHNHCHHCGGHHHHHQCPHHRHQQM